MSLIIKKENKDFYRLMVKDGDNLRTIEKEIKNILLPFGLEEFKSKYLVNFELSKKKDLDIINLIKLLESKILDIFPKNNDSLNVSSILKSTKNNDKVLCKGNIRKTKNTITTKYYFNGQPISIFELEKNILCKILIEISGIWKFKNKLGLFINIKKISR